MSPPQYLFMVCQFGKPSKKSMEFSILLGWVRSKWLLDLPDLEILQSILDFFNGKNNVSPNCLFLLKNDFQTVLFFSILGEWSGWVLESMENSILFLEGFPFWEIFFFIKIVFFKPSPLGKEKNMNVESSLYRYFLSFKN